MVTSNKKKYYPHLCKLMAHRAGLPLNHYDPRTQPMFPEEELTSITPLEVLRFLRKQTYGMEDPGPEDLPKLWRVDSVQFCKKALSHFMPHHGEWNTVTNHGNPTRDKSIQKMIADAKRCQVRKQGRKSRVKRDMTIDEFKRSIRILEVDHQNSWSCTRWANALRLQFNLIGRGDDIHHMKNKNLHQHPEFGFALETEMNWSKNVLDERDCPPQILLGTMNTSFCVLLSLATYFEVRFRNFGSNSIYIFSEDIDDDAPGRSLKTYSRSVKNKVFDNANFISLSSLTAGSLGMHSLRKFPSSWAKLMGCTQDERDIRGRWKRDQGSRISSRYINPKQPFIDAKVAGHLCIDGPIKYCWKEGAEVGPAFFHEHACPLISQYFDDTSKMPETLGPPLLWASFEANMEHRVLEWLRNRIKTAYESCRPPAFEAGVNPIKRVPLVIYKVGEKVCIEEMTPDAVAPDNPPAITGQRNSAERHRLQQGADHITSQLHSIQLKLSRLEERLEGSHGDLKLDIQRQLAVINKNIQRLQLMAPRQAVRQREATPTQTNAKLSRPRDLYSLWTEYTHGIEGNKPARDFTAAERGRVKQKYYRRNCFWQVVATHINAGWTAPAAVDRVYLCYGRDSSVTHILDLMLRDRRRYPRRVHPRLDIAPPGRRAEV